MVVALICGGGNGAHMMAATAATHPDTETRVLTLYDDEAERWTKNMAATGLTIVDTTGEHHHGHKEINSRIDLVSKNPEEVVPGADVILFTVPAFIHELYLNALKPHIKPGTILVGIPGQAGFEFAVRGSWGELAEKCTIMDFITLPWNCRTEEFGKTVHMMGVKDVIPGAVQLSKPPPQHDPVAVVQAILGPKPILETKGHFLGMSLSQSNPVLHPTIMYGTWSTWDGKPLDRKPLFYNDLSEQTASLLEACGNEVVLTAKAIMKKKPDVDLSHVHPTLEYYIQIYGDEIDDKSSLYTALRTCESFEGLTHPMIDTEDGKYLPRFKYRYLTEDVPCGMAVIRGIATIVGVPTPNIDKVLLWAQKIMDKEYLVNGEFIGKDINTTRAPQRYGLNTLDDVLGLK